MPARTAPTPPAPTENCGRTTLFRIFRIHQRLGHGEPATAVSLARELEVSDRTIKRDLEWMRDNLGADIAWDPATHSYRCAGPIGPLPLLRLDADEAIALVLAGRTFSAWSGSPLGRALAAAFGKIAPVLGSAVSLPADEIGRLVFQPDDHAETDRELRWFSPLLDAIRNRREVRLAYRKPGAHRAAARTVHPLHLAHLDHRWMLLAHDTGRRAPRNFLLARIDAVTPTARAFTPPANFDPRAHLVGGFGLHTGTTQHDVRLRFDALAAPFIRERRWHPTQAIRDLPRGQIEVTLRLNHLLDVRRWILSWGSHAEALTPAALRRDIRRESASTAKRHAR